MFVSITEFVYNNAINVSISHKLFEFNYEYLSLIFFEKEINPHLKSKSANKIAKKLKKLIIIWQQNLFYTSKLQKLVYIKRIKSRSYYYDKKIWLNSKYIKTQKNCKLKNKISKFFYILKLVGKQIYKFKLCKK